SARSSRRSSLTRRPGVGTRGGVAWRPVPDEPDRPQSARSDGRPPMPRDERGWQVAPAPDGRGMPEQPAPRPPHRRPGFLWFVLALIALNWLSLLVLQQG